MRVSNEFVLREIAGEYILVSVGTNTSGFHGIITLNETACTIFKALTETRTLDELVTIVLQEYAVDSATAQADVEDFLHQLRQIGALIEP